MKKIVKILKHYKNYKLKNLRKKQNKQIFKKIIITSYKLFQINFLQIIIQIQIKVIYKIVQFKVTNVNLIKNHIY